METTQTPQPVWRFLAGLQELDLQVWNEGGRLRVSAPPGVLTPFWSRDPTPGRLRQSDPCRNGSPHCQLSEQGLRAAEGRSSRGNRALGNFLMRAF